MTYLFGDATPFPLEENFIDTISAATDSCVALFELDVEQAERRRQAHEVSTQAELDTEGLANLARVVERALSPLMPTGQAPTTTDLTTRKIAEQAASLIQQARLSVLRRRDAGLRASKDTNLGPRVLEAMNVFFLEHQMPKTNWFHHWLAGRQPGESSLEFTSSSHSVLDVVYTVDIPESSRWAGPVRIEDIDPSYQLEFHHKGGWLKRGTHSGKIAVQRLFLTEVVRGRDSSWFMLRQHASKPSIGYKVFVRAKAHSRPVFFPIDAKDEIGEAMGLEDADEYALLELWKQLKAELRNLTGHRTAITSAQFRDQDVTDLDEPAELAECILMSLAPLIREIRKRSRVPGELVLKRDLGDGRREELFVPRRALEQKFAKLPYEQRACFTAVGLDSEATSDFLQRSDARISEAERTGDARAASDLRRARRIATSHDVA